MKTFVILGMHRSATSLIAKGLQESGVDMGVRHINKNKHNPHGHYENYSFINLNDHILKVAGGSWDKPPSEAAITALAGDHRITETIKCGIKLYSEGRELWGWKDPRTCLTIRLFEPYLVNPHYIFCFRQPEDVAISLEKRGCVDFEDGVALALEYNNRLKAFANDYC